MNFLYKRLLLLSAALLLSFNLQSAYAQVEIDVSGASVRGIPIAIVPFKVLDGEDIGHQIHDIVAFDLDATGKFESIDSSRFLSYPSRPEEFRAKDWRVLEAEVLVMGEVWNLGTGKYEVQFRIFDVAREQEVGSGKRISGLSKRELRAAAHVVADSVYTAYTGRPGAFQSNIAYVQKTEIEYQRYRYKLMVADWDGYDAREVYGSWKPILSPSWSPDRRQLAFVAYAQSGPVIRVIDLASGKTDTIAAFKGTNSAPAWSPDGGRIAYSSSRHGSPDVFVYTLATGAHQRINTHYAIDTEPAWSPDGRNLLFTSSRTGKPQIYSYNFSTQDVTRMTFDGDESANASYDFDGRNLAMVHEGGQIVVMNEENSRITWLTNAKYDESPSFSPNGDMVLYKAEQSYEPALMVASSDGRIRTRLTNITGDVREPAWSSLR